MDWVTVVSFCLCSRALRSGLFVPLFTLEFLGTEESHHWHYSALQIQIENELTQRDFQLDCAHLAGIARQSESSAKRAPDPSSWSSSSLLSSSPLVPSALLIWSRYFVVNSLLLHYCTGKHHFEFPPIRPIPWHESDGARGNQLKAQPAAAASLGYQR